MTGLGSRATSALLAVGTGAVLAVAAWLEPSTAGHGTHTQLGLPPCSFWAFTSWPCPMCGATTTFSLLAHGRVIEGVVNQPFAALLFLATLGVFAVSAAELVQPRRRWERLGARLDPVEGWLAGGMILAMMAGWAYKIAQLRGA